MLLLSVVRGRLAQNECLAERTPPGKPLPLLRFKGDTIPAVMRMPTHLDGHKFRWPAMCMAINFATKEEALAVLEAGTGFTNNMGTKVGYHGHLTRPRSFSGDHILIKRAYSQVDLSKMALQPLAADLRILKQQRNDVIWAAARAVGSAQGAQPTEMEGLEGQGAAGEQTTSRSSRARRSRGGRMGVV